MTSALRGRGLVKGDNGPLSDTPDRLRSWDVGSDNSDKGEGGKKYQNILRTSCKNGPLRKFGFFDGQNDRHLTGEGS